MRDLTLYKTSQDFEKVLELIEKDSLEDWEIEEFKAKFIDLIKSQSSDIIKFYINQSADIEYLKSEIKRLQTIKSAKEASLEKFRERLTDNMRNLHCPKLASPLGNITLSLEGEVHSVKVDDDIDFDAIPQEFVKVTKEIRKTDIKKAIEAGQTFKGVRIESTPSKASFRLGKESKEFIENPED
mgnify:CR=1 FL=1